VGIYDDAVHIRGTCCPNGGVQRVSSGFHWCLHNEMYHVAITVGTGKKQWHYRAYRAMFSR